MEKIKVLVAADNEEKRYELKNILTCDEIAIVAFAKTGEAILEKTASLQPEVVVMITEKNSGNLAEIAERIYMSIPSTTVLLLSENPDFSLVEKAMQAGIRKILPWPSDRKTLVETITLLSSTEKMRIANSKQRHVNWQSKVITVFGTKGGIGKTTIATNLAVSLSRSGKKVALIDLDLQFGDVGVFLDLEPKDSIAELVQERTTFDIDSIKSYMMLHSSGVNILSAPKSPEYADVVTGDHVEKIINTIRPYYDYVIIDTPPSFNDCTITAIENSNLVLFVLTLDISTLRNARISGEVFESLNQKDKIKLVVNRESDSGITVKDAKNVLGSDIFFKIPSDWRTAIAALNKGIPIVIDAPRTAMGQEFVKMAKVVSELKI